MYAILRGDLQMTAGKASAMAAHAVLDAFLRTPSEIAAAYQRDGVGTKVILVASDEVALREIEIRACGMGIPCAAVIEKDHIMPPHFTGEPILAAIGLGPIPRALANAITKDLRLMP